MTLSAQADTHNRNPHPSAPMNTFLRILACLALVVSGLAAALDHVHLIPPGTLSPDLLKRMMIASVLLLGAKEGIVAIGDILDDGKRNGSFSIEKLKDSGPRVLVALLCVLMVSCAGDKFMGLNSQQWGEVAMNTGKELGKQLPATAMQAYTSERLKPVTSAKQPVPAVNPAEADQAALLLPPVEASPSRSWLSSFFN